MTDDTTFDTRVPEVTSDERLTTLQATARQLESCDGDPVAARRVLVELGALCDDWMAELDQPADASEAGGPRSACTGDPCICTNGIGCVTVPVSDW